MTKCPKLRATSESDSWLVKLKAWGRCLFPAPPDSFLPGLQMVFSPQILNSCPSECACVLTSSSCKGTVRLAQSHSNDLVLS